MKIKNDRDDCEFDCWGDQLGGGCKSSGCYRNTGFARNGFILKKKSIFVKSKVSENSKGNCSLASDESPRWPN